MSEQMLLWRFGYGFWSSTIIDLCGITNTTLDSDRCRVLAANICQCLKMLWKSVIYPYPDHSLLTEFQGKNPTCCWSPLSLIDFSVYHQTFWHYARANDSVASMKAWVWILIYCFDSKSLKICMLWLHSVLILQIKNIMQACLNNFHTVFQRVVMDKLLCSVDAYSVFDITVESVFLLRQIWEHVAIWFTHTSY